MNRFSFSREPAALTGLVAAVLVFANTLGWHGPAGLEAAIDGVILAASVVFIRRNVRPVKGSITIDPAKVTHVNAEATLGNGSVLRSYQRFAHGRLEHSDATITAPPAYAGLDEVAAKSAADLRPQPAVTRSRTNRSRAAKAAKATKKKGG